MVKIISRNATDFVRQKALVDDFFKTIYKTYNTLS